jgi:hypothetical protein
MITYSKTVLNAFDRFGLKIEIAKNRFLYMDFPNSAA